MSFHNNMVFFIHNLVITVDKRAADKLVSFFLIFFFFLISFLFFIDSFFFL